jgi:hypothetical protein
VKPIGTCGQQPLPVSGGIAAQLTTKTRAFGDRAWMPCRTAAIFGAVAAILSASVSRPLTTYLSRQGCANGFAVAQFCRMLVKPMSLPPICSVTIWVSAVSALNCGGLADPG